jgi:hypothetical protein
MACRTEESLIHEKELLRERSADERGGRRIEEGANEERTAVRSCKEKNGGEQNDRRSD